VFVFGDCAKCSSTSSVFKLLLCISSLHLPSLSCRVEQQGLSSLNNLRQIQTKLDEFVQSSEREQRMSRRAKSRD